MKNLTKETYINMVKNALKVAGGVIIEGTQTCFRCQLPNKQILRIYFRYRAYPDNESRQSHFLPDAYDKMVEKCPADEIPAIAILGHYSMLGREQIVLFVLPIDIIKEKEKEKSSHAFAIGPTTKKHIVRMPESLYDEEELRACSLIYQVQTITNTEIDLEEEELSCEEFL